MTENPTPIASTAEVPHPTAADLARNCRKLINGIECKPASVKLLLERVRHYCCMPDTRSIEAIDLCGPLEYESTSCTNFQKLQNWSKRMGLHDDLLRQQASLKAAEAAVESARQPLLELAEAERAREQAAAGLKAAEEKWSLEKAKASGAWTEIEVLAIEFNRMAIELNAKAEELQRVCRQHSQLLRDTNSREPLDGAEALKYIPWINICGGLLIRPTTIAESKTHRATAETLALMERHSGTKSSES